MVVISICTSIYFSTGDQLLRVRDPQRGARHGGGAPLPGALRRAQPAAGPRRHVQVAKYSFILICMMYSIYSFIHLIDNYSVKDPAREAPALARRLAQEK